MCSDPFGHLNLWLVVTTELAGHSDTQASHSYRQQVQRDNLIKHLLLQLVGSVTQLLVNLKITKLSIIDCLVTAAMGRQQQCQYVLYAAAPSLNSHSSDVDVDEV